MVRPLAIAAVLLGALPEAFVLAGSDWNTCSEKPYAMLKTYEPAKEWCRSSKRLNPPRMHCGHRDFLCSSLSNLQAREVGVLWYGSFSSNGNRLLMWYA
jgi:hypothetical protein